MLAAMNTDKLGKLIKMLSSSNDGEVVAAAHAIMRTLEAEGADIHTLAERVEGRKLSQAEMQRIYDKAFAAGKQSAAEQQQPAFHDVTNELSWHAIACECVRSSRLRDQKERDFVADMVRWTVRGGEPTEKQAKWLRSIYVRVRR
jgi:hypothetical protein